MTFDLEKARAADEVLPYPLDAKEIWVSGKGQMHINPPNAPSIFFTLSDLCEFRNIFHGQAAEIERLREVIKTHNTREESALAEILMNELLVRQNAQIKELEAENKRVLLELQKSKNRNMCEERVKKDMQQAARIKELEDALVEERAKQFDVDEPCPARTHHEYCDILKGSCDGVPHMWEKCPRKQEKLDAARQQLHMEEAGFVSR